jgi:hypothetical protein
MISGTLPTGREVSVHFRSGYWSRPKGQGRNPEAQATIWHRWTIVRRDKLQKGEIPNGSIVTVPTPE